MKSLAGIKPFTTYKQRTMWELKHMYIVTCDRSHKKQHRFKGEGGELYELEMMPELAGDHKRRHPNEVTVVSTTDGADFKKGDHMFVKHFAIEDHDGNPHVICTDDDGTDYYRVKNIDVMCVKRGDTLVPREGVLLCKALRDKLYDTNLLLPPELDDYRRDLVQVHTVWPGCTLFSEGDLLLINPGGDYPFYVDGEEYLKVDYFFNDVIAKVDSTKWRLGDVKKRIRDHSKPAGGSW